MPPVLTGVITRMRLRRTFQGVAAAIAAYAIIAYLVVPEFWSLRDAGPVSPPREWVTRTPQGIPGDPINVALDGTEADLEHAFAAAGWARADRLDLETAMGIGGSVALDHPYPRAPVSTLLFDGRPQDLAFEKAVGRSADRRHHVRLWQAGDAIGRPRWLGSASFDSGIGLSRDTGQVTHHIGPDVDAERDFLIQELSNAGTLSAEMQIQGVGATLNGRNGGGDPYFTDGKARLGILRPAGH